MMGCVVSATLKCWLTMLKDTHGLTTESYGYCEDCQELFDLWKYNSIEDSGHADCHWRYVTLEEFEECLKDCEENGCFNEC